MQAKIPISLLFYVSVYLLLFAIISSALFNFFAFRLRPKNDLSV